MCCIYLNSKGYLTVDDPTVFVLCQWQKDRDRPCLPYVIYRWSVGIAYSVIFIISLILRCKYDLGKWYIFFTMWGLLLCIFQAWVAVYMITKYFLRVLRERSSQDDTGHTTHPKFLEQTYRLYWCSYTASTDSAFVISIVYWSLFFNKHAILSLEILTHCLNSIIMFADLLIVSHPFKLINVIFALSFGFIYLIFSFLYAVAGGTGLRGKEYIYRILNWHKPNTALPASLGIAAGYIVIHILCFSIYKLRYYIYCRTIGKKNTDVQ